jgi:ammonium transporter Rh
MGDTQGFAFIMAARSNHVDQLIYLRSEAKVNVNFQDYDGRCALHLAAAGGQLEALTFLCNDPDIDVNLKDNFGNSALDEAVNQGFDEGRDLLMKIGATSGTDGQQVYKFIKAAADGDLGLVRSMLSTDFDPSRGDYDGRTALHVAVALRHLDIVRELLKYDSNLSLSDRATRTQPLHVIKDNLGETPLDEVFKVKKRGFDPMKGLFEEFGHIGAIVQDGHHGDSAVFSKFSVVFSVMQVIMILLYFLFVEYDFETDGNPKAAEGTDPTRQRLMNLYGWFQDVHVMIFIGFGFLMTFLRKNGFSSLGFNFLISVFALQWHILVGTFFEMAINEGHWEQIHLTLTKLLYGDFAAGAVLITYGAVLGRVSHLQMMVVALLEVIFFSLNESIRFELHTTDMGGSVVVHMFGALFGLALSLALNRKNGSSPSNDNNGSAYHSDMFAMIGTVFLWMYWPSFNASPADNITQKHRAVVNTVLALAGSGLTGFISSHVLRGGKFDMVDIQNATLAGGVAMGSACDLVITPGGALTVGAFAGVLSTVGYTRIQAWLEANLGFQDTCGVNNLHGMPSILGALVGVVVTGATSSSDYAADQLELIYPEVANGNRDMGEQAWYQFAYMIVTMAIALSSGFVTGAIVKNEWFEPIHEEKMYDDAEAWEVPHEEIPYYFDHRGEIEREVKVVDPASAKGPDFPAILRKGLRDAEARLAKLELRSRQSAKSSPPTIGHTQPQIVMVPSIPQQGPSQHDRELAEILKKLSAQLDKSA